ncbi:DEAD/DEAH box helicase [Prevotella corporis]|uniref:DEAD/DEAH box helicase n=2 Tax=Prevotella corporis TaxID=28128 RepID=UPI001377F435|nr:DEAD/DEAH box helicase family protein [Prevotella corporis]
MEKILFQEKAIDSLLWWVKRLWRNEGQQQNLTFKAPTGSGKTYMTGRLICELAHQPDWQQDVAFVWITFSDDLAMQSRDKFRDYFAPNIPGRLLTISDFDLGRLEKNDVMFLNWQKLVSRKAENRVNRRPDDERMLKEQGYYYEDVVEQTHADGREIILVIDESHKNVTTASMRDVIQPMDPKLIIRVSATPEREPSATDVNHFREGYVEINRQEVVDAGMIKAEVVCQTEEDLRKQSGQDLDESLVKMAMEKRAELKLQIDHFGLAVNPLVLIQLPNDDAVYGDNIVQTKEEIVTGLLLRNGVAQENIACWFDQKKKPEGIEDNNSNYEYLLFKVAAGTGWDCPRAQILVMFREVKSATFHTQTVGRILRVPVRGVSGCDIFRTGYLYTNYQRNEVNVPEQSNTNKPKLYLAENRKGEDFEIDVKLNTEYIPRIDYGDLGRADKFQACLVSEFNNFFCITDNDIFSQRRKRLEQKGMLLNPRITRDIIVNAKFEDIDQISTDILKLGDDANVELSRNDAEKTFGLICVQLLREQEDDNTKIKNVSRSWSILKSALRIWLKQVVPNLSDDQCYRIFIKDFECADGGLIRRAFFEMLKAYKPNLAKQKNSRKEQAEKQEVETFVVKKRYAYTDDYEALEMKRCLFRPFYIRKNYKGRKTEQEFAEFLDAQETVDWWMKNGDSGKDFLSIRYESSEDGETHLFYPDWIVHYYDGTIGIYDTKGGITASSQDTHDKANELQRRIKILNGWNRENIRYIGGIVCKRNGMWMLNKEPQYSYQSRSMDEWEQM